MKMEQIPQSTPLAAGAARADITPEVGILLGGDISHKRPAEAIADHLWANVLVLESDGARLCLVSMDLPNVNRYWIDRIRALAAARFGFRPQAVMIHTLHNHAAPELGGNVLNNPSPYIHEDYKWMAGGDERYNEPTVQRIVAAIGEATAALRPVTVSVGRALDERWAFNRRFIMRDGSRKSNVPIGDTNILRSEHPIDPEVTVVKLDDARTGGTIAALLGYTCHATLGYGRNVVIGDWPGAWAEQMREHLGTDSVALVLNGCLGNVACKPRLLPGFEADYHTMAAGLFESALVALQGATPIEAPVLQHRQAVIDLPLRAPTEADVTWAQELLARHPTPDWTDDEHTRCSWDWRYAVEILDLAQTHLDQGTFAYEINVIRLGALALVMLMGEPFVEAQFDLKLASKADFTIVASLCNGYVGYLPTAEAWGGEGFEVRVSNHAKLQQDALATVTRGAVQLLDY